MVRWYTMLGSDPKWQNSRMVRQLVAKGALRSKRIISAFMKTDRRMFVPPDYAAYAYDDNPLPTVGRSTISQPYTVAVMAEWLAPKAGDRILEVGTGSGYNACILAECVGARGSVISVELDRNVAEFARRNIRRAGARNVTLVQGDGSRGYQRMAPYDGIIYTGAIPKIPAVTLGQLKMGAAALAPAGDLPQVLTLMKRTHAGFTQKELGHFLFVPIKSPRSGALPVL